MVVRWPISETAIKKLTNAVIKCYINWSLPSSSIYTWDSGLSGERIQSVDLITFKTTVKRFQRIKSYCCHGDSIICTCIPPKSFLPLTDFVFLPWHDVPQEKTYLYLKANVIHWPWHSDDLDLLFLILTFLCQRKLI